MEKITIQIQCISLEWRQEGCSGQGIMVHNLIVHVLHVYACICTCTFIQHIYTWCMCVPMELSTDCKLHVWKGQALSLHV